MWDLGFGESSQRFVSVKGDIKFKVIGKFAKCSAPPHSLPRANSRLTALILPSKLRTENDDLHRTKYEFIKVPRTKHFKPKSVPRELWEDCPLVVSEGHITLVGLLTKALPQLSISG